MTQREQLDNVLQRGRSMKTGYSPSMGKYGLMYHDFETDKTEMVFFKWKLARFWCLITKARRAVMEDRFQIINVQ